MVLILGALFAAGYFFLESKLGKITQAKFEEKDVSERIDNIHENMKNALSEGIFEEYKKVKDKNEKQEELIEGHERIIEGINAALSEIKESLEEQKEVNLKQIRHTIVHTCEAALERGEISINKLQSLEEMYAEYVDVFHGNGYVKTLVTKVRELRVVGKTDEK